MLIRLDFGGEEKEKSERALQEGERGRLSDGSPATDVITRRDGCGLWHRGGSLDNVRTFLNYLAQSSWYSENSRSPKPKLDVI